MLSNTFSRSIFDDKHIPILTFRILYNERLLDMKTRLLSVAAVLLVLANLSSAKIAKRVYADYHGGYGTRINDGSWEHWKLSGCAKSSKAQVTCFNHNPDLVKSNGQHEIASVLYPLVGVQSDNDPDYFEYQVLQAKVAHIDGFVIEWGNEGGHMDVRLPLMKSIAAKYDFKIGVNWCHNWLFMRLEKKDVRQRAAQIRAFEESLKHLISDVYSEETGIFVDGRPLVVLFGGGRQLNTKEFAKMLNEKNYLPAGGAEPLFLRGMAVGAFAKEDIANDYNDWIGLVDGNLAWIPGRPRGMDDGPLYLKTHDMYAISSDTVEYQKITLELNQLYAKKKGQKIRTNSATPGMDNRPSFGWGGKLKYVDWEDGQTYKKQWQFNVKNKSSIDIVFIDTWNDYPEATVIEPTSNFGFREIKTTEKYAAAFKEIKSDASGIELPVKLFKLRKKASFFEKIGFDVRVYDGLLDAAAFCVSDGEYGRAKEKMDLVAKAFADFEKQVYSEFITFSSTDKKAVTLNMFADKSGVFALTKDKHLKISVCDEFAKKLSLSHFDGYMEFDYLDEGKDNFVVYSQTCGELNKSERFNEICSIKKGDTGKWKHAKVRLFSENLHFVRDCKSNADFVFAGPEKVRRVSFELKVYSQTD